MSDNDSHNLKVMVTVGFLAVSVIGFAALGIGLWLWQKEIALIVLGTAMIVAGIIGAVSND